MSSNIWDDISNILRPCRIRSRNLQLKQQGKGMREQRGLCSVCIHLEAQVTFHMLDYTATKSGVLQHQCNPTVWVEAHRCSTAGALCTPSALCTLLTYRKVQGQAIVLGHEHREEEHPVGTQAPGMLQQASRQSRGRGVRQGRVCTCLVGRGLSLYIYKHAML